MENRGIREGMTVHSSDGKKLGKVVQCTADLFVIEKGFFFPKDFVARYDQVAAVDGDDVRLSTSSDALEKTGEQGDTGYTGLSEERTARPIGGAGMGLGASNDDSTLGQAPGRRMTGDKEELRMQLAEEELVAQKRERDAGEVRVRKEVVTEHRQIEVPVTKEEIKVERAPATGSQDPGRAAFKEDTISMPLKEEEVEIHKRPVVREEVRVSKDRRQVEQRADADVRREEAHVEREGDTHRTPDTGEDFPGIKDPER